MSTPKGIRIPVCSVKGSCPRPLDDGGILMLFQFLKSGQRDSNARHQPWQGCALPLSYARTKIKIIKFYKFIYTLLEIICQPLKYI
jgi:hypothetical protein